MYAIHAEPRALRAFSIIGCILDLDHLEEALRKKSPGFDATGAYRSQACAVKGLCQYVVRRCKRAKRTRITTYAVLGRLKARFHVTRSMCTCVGKADGCSVMCSAALHARILSGRSC